MLLRRFMLQRTAHRTMQALLSSLIRRQNSETLLPMSTDPNPTSLSALLLTVYFLAASYAIGITCTSPSGYSGRGLKLTTHLHCVSRLRMSGAMHFLPIHAFMTYTVNFNVTFLGAFAKLRHASFRIKQLGSHWSEFQEI